MCPAFIYLSCVPALFCSMNVEKLQGMAGAVRTGGKGTVRRKKKAVHKTTSTDDKRLQSTLKRLGVNTIPGIEEVNIFKGDDVIHFLNPKGAFLALVMSLNASALGSLKSESMVPGV